MEDLLPPNDIFCQNIVVGLRTAFARAFHVELVMCTSVAVVLGDDTLDPVYRERHIHLAARGA